MSIDHRNVEIIGRLAAGESGRSLAKEFGLSHSRVYQIAKGHPKNYVLSEEARAELSARAIRLRAEGIFAGRTVDDGRTALVMRAVAEGRTYSQIAARLGITRNTVAGIVHRAAHKPLTAETNTPIKHKVP